MSGEIISSKLHYIGGLNIAGGGQIVAHDNHLFIGHMKPPHGTTIVDVNDPANPVVVAEIAMGSPYSHSHKVRVAGNLMITNVEQDRRHFLRKGDKINEISNALAQTLSRTPEEGEIAEALGVTIEELAELRSGRQRGYGEGGFKLWDVSDPDAPRIIELSKNIRVWCSPV